MKSSSSSKRNADPGLQVRNYLAALPADTRKHVQQARGHSRGGRRRCGKFRLRNAGLQSRWKIFRMVRRLEEPQQLLPDQRVDQVRLAADLEGFEASGKGTIRFRLDEPLPTALVKRLVKARIAELRKKQKKP